MKQMEILLFFGSFSLQHFFVTVAPVLSSFRLKEWDFGAIWGQFLDFFWDDFLDVTSIWLNVKSEIILYFSF